jgi:hypothetical protein
MQLECTSVAIEPATHPPARASAFCAAESTFASHDAS